MKKLALSPKNIDKVAAKRRIITRGFLNLARNASTALFLPLST